MKITFFDAKPYDRPGFDAYTAGTGLEMKYFEAKLNEDTVSLASGFDGVCVFVNDTLNDAVVRELQCVWSQSDRPAVRGIQQCRYPSMFRENPGIPCPCVLPLRCGRACNGTAAHSQPAYQ